MSQQLCLTEVVQTKSGQRIMLQPVRLDRIVASLAEAVRAGIDSLQSGVNLRDEIVEVGSGNRGRSRLQSSAPVEKLRPECVTGGHGSRIHFVSPPEPRIVPYRMLDIQCWRPERLSATIATRVLRGRTRLRTGSRPASGKLPRTGLN